MRQVELDGMRYDEPLVDRRIASHSQAAREKLLAFYGAPVGVQNAQESGELATGVGVRQNQSDSTRGCRSVFLEAHDARHRQAGNDHRDAHSCGPRARWEEYGALYRLKLL